MDEVMADTYRHCLDLYNARFNRTLTPENCQGQHLFEAIPPEHRDEVRSFFDTHEFFAGITVMAGALEVIEALSRRYEVFVVSAAMDVPVSFAAKFEWLERHFPFIPTSHIVFCGDKSIVLADYLIDDNIRQLNAFRGQGLLFHAPHNTRETRWKRVKDWWDVRGLLLANE